MLSLQLLALATAVAAQIPAWEQCAGAGHQGSSDCVSGFTCEQVDTDYSTCLPDLLDSKGIHGLGAGGPNGASLDPLPQSASAAPPPASSSAAPSRAPRSAASQKAPASSAPAPAATGSEATGKVVGRLPALGWNDWNAYNCGIDEAKILSAADSLVKLGLKDAGYEYVNIDDCWSNKDGRSADGKLQVNTTKFPSGIDGVASKIHGMGLKVGIYSDAGPLTCAGYPGSLTHEDVDAQTFAAWGIDYLKYDNCNVPDDWKDAASYADWTASKSFERYDRMTAALRKVTRPIQFNLCIWGSAHVWDWGAQVGHSWRMTDDANPSWAFVTSAIATNAKHLDKVGFGAHNDMDMLEIGNGQFSIQEQRTHFAVWAAMKSPILLGADLSKLTQEQVGIVGNKELLAFHQDEKVGEPAKPFGNIWSPPDRLAGQSTNGTCVFLTNYDGAKKDMHIQWKDVPGLEGGKSYMVVDMWTGKELGELIQGWGGSVESHDTVALRIEGGPMYEG